MVKEKDTPSKKTGVQRKQVLVFFLAALLFQIALVVSTSTSTSSYVEKRDIGHESQHNLSLSRAKSSIPKEAEVSKTEYHERTSTSKFNITNHSIQPNSEAVYKVDNQTSQIRVTANRTQTERQPMNKRKGGKETFRPAIRVKCRKRPKVLNQIRVANLSENDMDDFAYPRILCFVMSHAKHHLTRVRIMRRTWGRKCDKLVVASDQTDSKFDAVAMESNASYSGLWQKLNETLQYLSDNFYDKETNLSNYDWILKADDDTYVIMENLKQYLASPGIVAKSRYHPMIHGRRYSFPQYKNLRPIFFDNPLNHEFKNRFFQKIDGDNYTIYNYGGAAYAMNWRYVQLFLEAMKGPNTLHGPVPEDVANGIVMAYHDVWPENTRDSSGRERFHQESPNIMYSMSENYQSIFSKFTATGGISIGQECCSEQSISFHHLSPIELENLDQFLYNC